MFRLAVADPESGVISINVSALSRHRFGLTLHASLEAFVHGTPMDYLHQMSRIDDSEERAFNIVYYSTLLHELRHFFDFLMTPYGAFTLRSTVINYQLLLGLMQTGEPLIVPFTLGADPFIAKHELGIQNYETSQAYAAACFFKKQQDVFAGDRRGFRHENGRLVQFGGSAMLEALAFDFQRTFLNFSTLRTPNLERTFPEAFADYDGNNPSKIDVIYRWLAPFQMMIGNSQNEAVAKILYIIAFSSLCGRYRSGAARDFKRDLAKISQVPVFDLSSELPSKIFQTLLSSVINRFEGKSLDRNTTWDDSWDIVNDVFRKEFGRSIIESIAFDIGEDERLTAAMVGNDPTDEINLRHLSTSHGCRRTPD